MLAGCPTVGEGRGKIFWLNYSLTVSAGGESGQYPEPQSVALPPGSSRILTFQNVADFGTTRS